MATPIMQQFQQERLRQMAQVEPVLPGDRELGALGDIPFTVSREKVQTIGGLKWSFGTEIAEHKLVNGDTLTEPTGRKPGEMELPITVTRSLGVDPMELISKIKGHSDSFTPLVLIIGEHRYGRYRWLIEDCTIGCEVFAPGGGMYSADITIKLKEYLKGG